MQVYKQFLYIKQTSVLYAEIWKHFLRHSGIYPFESYMRSCPLISIGLLWRELKLEATQYILPVENNETNSISLCRSCIWDVFINLEGMTHAVMSGRHGALYWGENKSAIVLAEDH